MKNRTTMYVAGAALALYLLWPKRAAAAAPVNEPPADSPPPITGSDDDDIEAFLAYFEGGGVLPEETPSPVDSDAVQGTEIVITGRAPDASAPSSGSALALAALAAGTYFAWRYFS